MSVLTGGDWIELEGLRVHCIVGVGEQEQHTSQPVVFELALRLPLTEAGETGNLAQTIDYAAVADEVRAIAQHGRFRLIETLALAVCRHLLAPPEPVDARARVEEVRVRVAKPAVLGGNPVPAVHLSRVAGEVAVQEVAPGVAVQELVSVPEGGAWRVRLGAGARWEAPGDAVLHVMSGEVEVGGRRFGPGERTERGGDREVRSKGGALLLVVGRLWAASLTR